jgi:hypothetical protein
MTDNIKEYQKWRSHVYQMPDCRLPRRVFNNIETSWKGGFRKTANEMV